MKGSHTVKYARLGDTRQRRFTQKESNPMIYGRRIEEGYGPYVCRTNLDGYERVVWPTHFVAPPRVGESVGAPRGSSFRSNSTGEHIVGAPVLRIVSVTHYPDYTELELHR